LHRLGEGGLHLPLCPEVLENKGPREYEKVKSMQLKDLGGQNPEEYANKWVSLSENANHLESMFMRELVY